jgi:hypothetical protein
MDDQYEQGYRRVPEDVAEVTAALRVAPVPPEDWT